MENIPKLQETATPDSSGAIVPLALPQPLPGRASEADASSIELVSPAALLGAGVEDDSVMERAVLPDHVRQISFRLELRVPVSHFTLRDLQDLKPGALLATEHLSVRDLVLTAAGERLLLVELESIEQELAARVKRLAWRHKWRRKA